MLSLQNVLFCILSPCLHRPGENMDNTIIQEASASETMNGDATPECAADIPSDAAAATTDAAPAATETKSYDDLFPSLPTSGRNPAAGGPANNAWNRKPVLASSTVTQVRYVNMYMPRGEQCSCPKSKWGGILCSITMSSRILINLELGLLLLLGPKMFMMLISLRHLISLMSNYMN